MHSQKTELSIVENEKKLVRKLTGLNDSDQIELNDIGWTSRVYIVNGGQFVVKFPRSDEVRKEYEQEIAILKLLEQVNLGVLVPKIRWTHPNNDFLGYEGIIGEAFDQIAEKSDVEVAKRIGRAIGAFLQKLHAQEVDGARTMTIDDEIAEFQYKYELGLPIIARDFSESEQARLRALIHDEMPSELLRLGGDLSLCHGDLGYWNIILGKNGAIGVIDFGDIGYYDRSKDFIGLEDQEALDAALKVYGDGELLRQKIAIRQKVLPILDLPFYIGKEDEVGVKRTVAKIKRSLE